MNFRSREVQVALEKMTNFSTSIRDYSLELLQHIKTLMHVPHRTRYPPLTSVEVLASYTRICQGKDEKLIDHLSRFKSETEVAIRMFGKGLTVISYQTHAYQDLPESPNDNCNGKR